MLLADVYHKSVEDTMTPLQITTPKLSHVTRRHDVFPVRESDRRNVAALVLHASALGLELT
jgi:hypothetical protein